MQRRSNSWLPLSAAAAQVWALDQLRAARSSEDRRNGHSNHLITALAAKLDRVRAAHRSRNGRA
jgi:hypothetical protein